jgi:hypothetical protein
MARGGALGDVSCGLMSIHRFWRQHAMTLRMYVFRRLAAAIGRNAHRNSTRPERALLTVHSPRESPLS